MDLGKIASRVASAAGRTAADQVVLKLVGQYESLADLLRDLVDAVRADVEVAEGEGVDVVAIGLMAERADVLEEAMSSLVPRIEKLDRAISAETA